MKLKFCQCCSISLTFNDLFPRDSMGNCLWCYFMLLFISLALGKCKKVCNMLKISLVLEFCPWKTKITCFPVAFVLKKLKNQLRITWATLAFQIWRIESFLIIANRKHRKMSENQVRLSHFNSEPLKITRCIFSWIKTLLEVWFSPLSIT